MPYIYSAEDDYGNNLILSYECHYFCYAIVDNFETEYDFLNILQNRQIKIKNMLDFDLDAQDINVIVSLMLILVASISLGDTFNDTLNNTFLIRLLKRFEAGLN